MKINSLPLVTVVTVTRNAEALIKPTLVSVCSQSYGNIEYIVVDGSSNDETINIIKKEFSHGISRFISEEDHGIYDAMNKGLNLADSESRLIHFLNAGDVYCDPNAIETMVAAFVSCARPSHVYGDIMKDGKKSHLPSKIDQYTLSTNMICHQAIFFQTPAHRTRPYDTTFRICADYKLLIDMVKAGEHFCKVHQPIVEFDSSGISRQNRAVLYSEKKKIRKLYPRISLYYHIKQFLKPLK